MITAPAPTKISANVATNSATAAFPRLSITSSLVVDPTVPPALLDAPERVGRHTAASRRTEPSPPPGPFKDRAIRPGGRMEASSIAAWMSCWSPRTSAPGS